MRPAPVHNSATDRRDLRRKVRNALGVTRDELPSAQTVAWAARDLSRLLWLTSGGRLRLAPEIVGDNTFAGDEFKQWTHAINVAMGEAEPQLPKGQLKLEDDQ